MFIAFALVGIIGLSAMTWLWPAGGLLLFRKKEFVANEDGSSAASMLSAGPARQTAVLIPARNEEQAIRSTLISVKAAAASCSEMFPQVFVTLHVGADGCTDKTEEVAREEGAHVLVEKGNLGKWRMLKKLVESVPEADFIVLSDSGALWPRDFLAKALARCRGDVVGVAPAYRMARPGAFSNISWQVEGALKGLEAELGGPVSVHGATALYRGDELRAAVKHLGDGPWLNDDVVIPLLVRALWPQKSIAYLKDVFILDAGTGPVKKEFTRRKRMMLGNIQWITSLFGFIWQHNRIAGILALRRVSRVFWIYWVLAISCALAAGLTLAGYGTLVVLAGVIGLLAALLNPVLASEAVNAAAASLIAPYYLLTAAPNSPEAAWR